MLQKLFLIVAGCAFAVGALAADVAGLRSKAETGDAEAQFELGQLYVRGEGVSADDLEASRWFARSAEQGFTRAQHNLGVFYLEGRGVKADPKEAARWLRLSANQGLARSQTVLGILLLRDEKLGGQRNEALGWLEKASTQGDELAQLRLADVAYFPGEGQVPDYLTAFRWYRVLAERGHAAAENALGVMLESGLPEGPPDAKAAAMWFERAARKGERKAQSNLGQLYQEGRGVERDDVRAYAWMRISAEAGEVTARNALPDHVATLSSAQIAEGDRLIEKLRAEIRK